MAAAVGRWVRGGAGRRGGSGGTAATSVIRGGLIFF